MLKQYFLLTSLFLLVFTSIVFASSIREQANTMFLYGVSYHAEGDLDRAKNHYEYAITLYPYDERVYASLSYLYLELGDVHKGIATLTTAIERFPKNTDFLYHRAYFYIQIGSEKLAFADWNMIIKRDKNNTQARWQRGHYLLQQGDYLGAKADFENLDKYDADPSKIATFFLAQTLQALGEYEQADKKFKEYAIAIEKIKDNPEHPIGEAYFHIARNLRLAGKTEEASYYYGKAIDAKFWPSVTSSQRVEAQKYSDHYLNINKSVS